MAERSSNSRGQHQDTPARSQGTRSVPWAAVIVGLVLYWSAFSLYTLLVEDQGLLKSLLGFPALLFIPGFLITHRLGVRSRSTFESALYTVAFGLLAVMLTLLVTNAVLPTLGVTRPLDKGPVTLTLWVLVSGLGLMNLRHLGSLGRSVGPPPVQAVAFTLPRADSLKALKGALNGYDVFTVALSAALVGLSVLGTNSLNNDGPNTLTLAMLLFAAALIVFMVAHARRLNAFVLPLGIYLTSLALLLMTSLRGWYTTGHDVQREFRVFQLASDTGSWVMARYQDSYNACLSITILPTAMLNLLDVPSVLIFKVFFQIIFALVPVAVYLFCRRYASRRMSLLVWVYFVSFPTYFGDMPMLNRQEIGFLYLSGMLLVITNDRLALKLRQALFIPLAVGLVVTHYSTTYATIFALGVAVALTLLYRYLGRFEGVRRLAERSRIRDLAGSTPVVQDDLTPSEPVPAAPTLPAEDLVRAINHGTHPQSGRSRPASPRARTPGRLLITPVMLLALIGANYLWVNVVTGTSKGISNLIFDTIESFTGQRRGDEQSSDVAYSLFNAKKFDLQKSLNEYDADIRELRAQAPPGVFYSDQALQSFQVRAAPEVILPTTTLGHALERLGIDTSKFNYVFRQSAARLLQLLILIGLIFYLYNRAVFKTLPFDLFAFAMGSLAFVVLIVLMPFLSVEYGLLRAFQQALMVLGPFIVLGTMAITWKFSRRVRLMTSLSVALLFFLSMTGVIPQTLGGYYPQLHLNNAGKYYDIYYVHQQEIAGVEWLGRLINTKGMDPVQLQASVQTDRYAVNRLGNFFRVNSRDDIYPGLLRPHTYVFLGYAHLTKREAIVNFNSDLLPYHYPVDLLGTLKDTIYDNRGVKIYR